MGINYESIMIGQAVEEHDNATRAKRVTSDTLATEATLQAVLAASGGSTFSFIQSIEDATYKYYGYTDGTNWKIKRKTLSSGVWKVATGIGDYDTAWADRAGKTYNYT